MYKQKKLNRYQRDVRKFLEIFLGYKYPYYLETTGKNHLRIIIKHIGPIITSGTPSDANAIKNFRAEVKRKVREYENNLSEKEAELPIVTSRTNSKINLDDIMLTGIRALKARIEGMKKNEKAKVLEENSTEVIKVYRNEVISETVDSYISKNKINSYVPKSEINKIKKAMLEHLNFIMPSIAEYASFLKQPNEPLFILSEEDAVYNKQSQPTEVAKIVDSRQIAKEAEEKGDERALLSKMENKQTTEALNNAMTSKKQKSKSKSEKMLNSEIMKKDITFPVVEDLLSEPQVSAKKEIILNENSKNRINQLRQLSFFEANALIEDIQKAIALNREEQMLTILKLMAQNGISLDDLKAKSIQ